MDFILPNDTETEQLKKGYDEMLLSKRGAVCSFSRKDDNCNPDEDDALCVMSKDTDENQPTESAVKDGKMGCETHDKNPLHAPISPSTKLLVLYFALAFVYNSTYGTSISYTHSSMGRLQPSERSVGNVNGFFRRT